MHTICLFGIYDPEYSRNRVLIEGFRENGWGVVECRVDPKIHTGLSKYFRLIGIWRQTRKYFRENKINPKIILVAFPGHTVVWLARILFLGHKIFFDAFLSRFDSNVYDRKAYKPLSLYGVLDWLLDWSSCFMANNILLDTKQHADYFHRNFFVRISKIIVVPVGTDTKNFFPRQSNNSHGSFIVHFHGMFIPLQGLRYIIDAAEILKKNEDIVFKIIGSGQQYREISEIVENKKLDNVLLLGIKLLVELPQYIKDADICLGIFGETDKTERVIPNKIYEYAAMKKAIITSDTPAIREFFTNETDMLLCKRANGKSLADAIMRLKDDRDMILRLADNSYALFSREMKPVKIVSDFLKSI